MIEIRKYKTNNKIPFDQWLLKLNDPVAKVRILARLKKLAEGLEGDWKSVGGGVRELRIFVGQGYRVYYGLDGETVVILLCGGNKSTQQRDIEKAKAYWSDYCE
jgi:putative addiction module killer protein